MPGVGSDTTITIQVLQNLYNPTGESKRAASFGWDCMHGAGQGVESDDGINSDQDRDPTVLLNLYRLRGRLQECDLQQVFAHHVDYYLEVISMRGKS